MKRKPLIAGAVTLLILIPLLAVMFIETTGIAADVVFRLLLGWPLYLIRVSRKVHVSGDGLVVGVACLILTLIGLHWFLRWFYREMPRREGAAPARAWSFRWTIAIVLITVLMFVTGIAATVIIHQTIWLGRHRQPLLTARITTMSGIGAERESDLNLKMIGLGMHNFLSANGSGGGGLEESTNRSQPGDHLYAWRQGLHSWQTMLMPFLPYWIEGLRYDLPWNAPENSAYFRGIIPYYLNPTIGVVRDERGYALSHYAGNVHVLDPQGSLGRLDGQNGASNTILAGEVVTRFKAWGDPTNLRDPGLGINAHPDGFGSPSEGGANMLMLDGSVRFLTNSTDPSVLRRMSALPESGKP